MLDENVSDDGIPTLQQDHRIELRHLLVRLSKAAGVLPSSMFLQNVQCIDRESVAGGAFADIFVARSASGIEEASKFPCRPSGG